MMVSGLLSPTPMCLLVCWFVCFLPMGLMKFSCNWLKIKYKHLFHKEVLISHRVNLKMSPPPSDYLNAVACGDNASMNSVSSLKLGVHVAKN